MLCIGSRRLGAVIVLVFCRNAGDGHRLGPDGGGHGVGLTFECIVKGRTTCYAIVGECHFNVFSGVRAGKLGFAGVHGDGVALKQTVEYGIAGHTGGSIAVIHLILHAEAGDGELFLDKCGIAFLN